MFPTTPTLPTVIITPSTPQYYSYIPPKRSSRSSRSSHTPSPTHTTRKQHLASALELGPPLFPSETLTEKSSSSRIPLLPSPLNLEKPTSRSNRRRGNGVFISLLILGLFGLVLVGPMLPYRYYAKSETVVPALAIQTGGTEVAVVDNMDVQIEDVGAQAERRRRSRVYRSAMGTGEELAMSVESVLESPTLEGDMAERVEGEEGSWRSTMWHGFEWALFD